jgi:hypothetical protein
MRRRVICVSCFSISILVGAKRPPFTYFLSALSCMNCDLI